jgi:hypothetical protein
MGLPEPHIVSVSVMVLSTIDAFLGTLAGLGLTAVARVGMDPIPAWQLLAETSREEG